MQCERVRVTMRVNIQNVKNIMRVWLWNGFCGMALYSVILPSR